MYIYLCTSMWHLWFVWQVGSGEKWSVDLACRKEEGWLHHIICFHSSTQNPLNVFHQTPLAANATLLCIIQRSAKVGAPGLVNFITAVAYQLCLNLPAAFMQPGAPTLANLCTENCFSELLINEPISIDNFKVFCFT